MSPDDERRLIAIARAAADLASRGSLETILTSIAAIIHQLGEVAAVQVVLAEPPDNALRLMGVAGFAPEPAFADILNACRERGAALVTFDAPGAEVQRVLPGRRAAMLASPEWEPMHDYIRQVEWDAYVASPMPLTQAKGGVINCYLAPGAAVTDGLTEFLRIMADQAALAVDYHALLERDRQAVRHSERLEVARELHDSVLEKVVTLVASSTGALRDLAREAEADLRDLVTTLGPGSSDRGLTRLSPREREILPLLGHGLSNQAIAAYLGISERTARTHVSNMLMKLGVSSRTQAALLARRVGLPADPAAEATQER